MKKLMKKKKKNVQQKTGNLTFLAQIDLLICPSTFEFFQIFSNFHFFFFEFRNNDQKSPNFDMFSQ